MNRLSDVVVKMQGVSPENTVAPRYGTLVCTGIELIGKIWYVMSVV